MQQKNQRNGEKLAPGLSLLMTFLFALCLNAPGWWAGIFSTLCICSFTLFLLSTRNNGASVKIYHEGLSPPGHSGVSQPNCRAR